MFSIKRMLCYVTGVGIAVAAMANPSEMIASVALNFTIALFCTIVVAACIVSMPKRTYYVSFAVFCGVHFMLASPHTYNSDLLLPNILFAEFQKVGQGLESDEVILSYPEFSMLPHTTSFYTPFSLDSLNAPIQEAVFRHTIWRASWSILIGEIAGIVALFIVRRKVEKGLAEKSRPTE